LALRACAFEPRVRVVRGFAFPLQTARSNKNGPSGPFLLDGGAEATGFEPTLSTPGYC